jgi:predicted AlkP superfamily pyrophosphatase or phosphodiesterase
VRVKTLFEAVREAGGTTAALSWPVTVGAPIDWNLPEYSSLDGEADPVTVLRTVEHPAGLLAELEREAVGRLEPWELSTDYVSLEDRVAAMAAYLIEMRKPMLLAVHLISTDHFQHREGRSGPLVTESVAAVDRAIAVMIEAAERAGILDRTAFVIVGDHGFIDLHTLLYPNHWLVQAGLHGPGPDRGDWRAAFHSAGGAAYLYLRRPEDQRTLDTVRRVLEALPHARRRLFRVLDRADIARLGGDPEAALALAAVPGVYFNERTGRGGIGPVSGGGHGYHPDESPDIRTGFVAWGAGIRVGAVAPILALEDIAPTVAALLGVDLDAPDGAAVPGLMERSR